MTQHLLIRTLFASVAVALFGCSAPNTGILSEPQSASSALAAMPVEMVTEPFSFEFEGRRYAGLLDTPAEGDVVGLVLLVHGSGRTNVASGDAYRATRELFIAHSFATYTYDKAGNGDSEGMHNSDQPVENSAQEALAAIAQLRAQGVPGSERIGLWGISRAGWINPLIIAEDPAIAFWISVSGPGPLSNMTYLLESNWKLRGYEESDVEMLLAEWLLGSEIQREGGSYEDYLAATPNLSTDPFMLILRGEYTEQRFLSYQNFLQENPPVIDPETGLTVFIEDFEAQLSEISIPVLAQFGERDTQVDWRATTTLYERTIGRTGNLTVVTFPDCNHMIRICEDCGFRDRLEKISRSDTGETCPGYSESISEFLTELQPR